MRMLFVTWNDGHPPAQFSLPAGTMLEQITNEPVVLDDEAHTELMIDAQRVRAAYLVDVPDNTMIADLSEVPVEPDIFSGKLDDEPTETEWPRLDHGMST